MAARLHGPIELAFAIGAATDHGTNGAVRCHHHHRCLSRLARRALRSQNLINGALRRQLHGPVKCRHNVQIGARAADKIGQLVERPIDRIMRSIGGTIGDGDFLRRHHIGFLHADKSGIAHGGNNNTRALRGGGRVACRGITRRGFQQTGQHGRFDMCQILHRAVEIGFRCRLHTISAAAEIDAIEIERQNILFGKMRLQPKGQQQFLHFTFETAFRCQENIFRQLLSQGRASLYQTPLSEIDRHGPR